MCQLCDKPVHARDLCSTHYVRLTRKEDWDPKKYVEKQCTDKDCIRIATNKGMCNMHYMRMYRASQPKKPRKVKVAKVKEVNEVRSCTEPNCVSNGYYGDGKCKKHWMREYRIRRKAEIASRINDMPDTPEAFWEFVKAELNIE